MEESPLIHPNAPLAVERGISTLITDAIALAIRAERADDDELEHTLVRASILSSALFLEAAANCCLDLLDLGARFAAEVDRLPTIAKYDIFLRIRHRGRALDRSRAEYQGFAELKALRDAFVHPKAQRFDWVEWSEDGSVSTAPTSKSLGMTTIPTFCFSKDSVIALRAAHAFARYFFVECARLKPRQVNALLYSEAKVPDLSDWVIPSWPSAHKLWLRERGIDLSYMRMHWHDA